MQPNYKTIPPGAIQKNLSPKGPFPQNPPPTQGKTSTLAPPTNTAAMGYILLFNCFKGGH